MLAKKMMPLASIGGANRRTPMMRSRTLSAPMPVKSPEPARTASAAFGPSAGRSDDVPLVGSGSRAADDSHAVVIGAGHAIAAAAALAAVLTSTCRWQRTAKRVRGVINEKVPIHRAIHHTQTAAPTARGGERREREVLNQQAPRSAPSPVCERTREGLFLFKYQNVVPSLPVFCSEPARARQEVKSAQQPSRRPFVSVRPDGIFETGGIEP